MAPTNRFPASDASQDSLETKYRFSDHCFSFFDATYRHITGKAINRPEDYYTFGMLTGEDTLTFVGALFADQCPIPQSRIICTRWYGLKKEGQPGDQRDHEDYQGNALFLLNSASKFVHHNSSVMWKKTGTGRIELSEYPTEAVYEALVNALVHRDYVIQESEIHIDIFDNRLEIMSPGGMPCGSRIQDQNLDDIITIRRNPILCDIFSRLELMERRGGGLRKIVDSYPEGVTPAFRSTAQSFIVTLKNLNYRRVFTPNSRGTCERSRRIT